MKRILVTGAGGPAGRNVIESLRAAREPFYIVGTDVNPYHLHLADADASYVVPRCTEPGYLDALNAIIPAEDVTFVHPQPDVEVAVLAENRDGLAAPTRLPAAETVRTCQDKIASGEAWYRAGLRSEPTVVIRDADDLRRAARELGLPLWLRASRGAGACGSTPVRRLETGLHWFEYWRSRGTDWTFIAEEYLPGRDTAFASLWEGGELLGSVAMHRVEYLIAGAAPSGKTGSTAVLVSLHDDGVNRAATEAVRAIDPRATGVFSVDLRDDPDGMPVPTEINCGRFFAHCRFYAAAGANLPYHHIRHACGESVDGLSRYNTVEAGLLWLRDVDSVGRLARPAELEDLQRASPEC
ncbi:MAG: hypothetical protein R6V05_10980 [Candidatus Brocadiia bacterium]